MDLGKIDKTVQTNSNLSEGLLLRFPEPGLAVFKHVTFYVRSGRGCLLALVALIVCGGAAVTAIVTAWGHVPHLGLILGLVGLVVAAMVAASWRVPPVVFDKKQGRFWRQGRRDRMIGDFGLIRDILAVQVCSAYFDFKDDGFWDYELNVVLKGSPCLRFPVVRRSDRDMAFEDAAKLAEFLAVPLLDHTDKASTPSAFSKRVSDWLLKK